MVGSAASARAISQRLRAMDATAIGHGRATGFGGGEDSGGRPWLLLTGLFSTVAGLVIGTAWLRAHPPRPIRGLQRD